MRLLRVGVGAPIDLPGERRPTSHVVARDGVEIYWDAGLVYVWKKGVELPEIIPAGNITSMTPFEPPKRK